jgi:hypothetical protein
MCTVVCVCVLVGIYIIYGHVGMNKCVLCMLANLKGWARLQAKIIGGLQGLGGGLGGVA